MKKPRGFTLIELVVVIVVIGILAAVALAAYVNLVNQATDARVRGKLGSIRSAITMAYAFRSALGIVGTPFPDENELTANVSAVGGYAFFTQGPVVNDLVGRSDFATSNNVNPVLCSEIETPAFGWLVNVQNGRVWATTPNCAQHDPITW